MHFRIQFLRGKELNASQEQYFCHGADFEAALNIQQTWPYLTYNIKIKLPSLLRVV